MPNIWCIFVKDICGLMSSHKQSYSKRDNWILDQSNGATMGGVNVDINFKPRPSDINEDLSQHWIHVEKLSYIQFRLVMKNIINFTCEYRSAKYFLLNSIKISMQMVGIGTCALNETTQPSDLKVRPSEIKLVIPKVHLMIHFCYYCHYSGVLLFYW